MTSTIETIPQGYGTVTPWIVGRDTRSLISFLKAAFGADELSRMENPDGKIGHAELRIGTSIVMAFDAPDGWPETPALLRFYLPDAEASFHQAIAAGAEPITKPTLLAFGDKVGRVRDPFGNIYWLQQRVEAVSEAEMNQRWSEPKWAHAMDYVQSSLAEALRTTPAAQARRKTG